MADQFLGPTKMVLSPAAQAVLDAFAADNYGVYLEGDPERIAAALRAAADQLDHPSSAHTLYAIAAELDPT
jgi:hypothetical protein